MNKNYFSIIIIIIFLVVIGFISLNKLTKNQNTQILMSSKSVIPINKLDEQTNNNGSVTVSVAPYQSINTGIWEFEIVLNTHSVELDYDLTKTAILIANGKEYQPIAYNGDSPGGHHRKGILKFPPILPQPQSIILKLLQIGGVEERNFVWQLK